jgi:hypothetical protein
MKRIVRLFTLAVILFSITAFNSNAQDYKTGFGFRLGGFTSGVNVKAFLNERGAIEGIIGFGRRSFVTTGLYQHHFPLENVQGLSLYGGGGAHVGFFWYRGTYLIYRYKNESLYAIDDNGRSTLIPGIDAVFGIEYKFKGAPFVIGADLKPFVDFYEGVSGYPDGAVNVRFVF